MTFTVNLAGKNIEITCIYPEFKDFCKDYIVEDCKPDFSISWTQADIAQEDENCSEQKFSLTYLETLAALRKIANRLPEEQRMLLHGASIAYHGDAYLFTAPSGTGKSTHIRLWHKYLGDDVKIVNGDKPFISLDCDKHTEKVLPMIYGTPWAGKENWHKNRAVPLKGICFLTRGTENKIRRITPSECLPFIMKQVYIPSVPIAVGLTLELLDLLLKNVSLYILECDISEDAVRCSFEAMTGMTYPGNKQ